ncbi:M15 family metallopeptidase [uncultured Amaricoccus sp.]|uniref:M15 family metallopeptidase n=1 Tax=uncultured Amaricoccus sp. TaxID=339341 RepID=UPI002638F359|nr:M15 family metallopeptidase [uncultured Amaricoccus sp.]
MKGSNVVAAAVVGACLVLAAATFALVSQMLGGADQAGGAAVQARIQRQLDDQARDIRALDQRVRELAAARDAAPPPAVAPVDAPAIASVAVDEGGVDQFGGAAPPPETEGLIDQMRLAADRFNQGIERPRPQVLLELLGNPRESYGQDCQPVTNPRMLAALETRDIASFKLTMMRPALDSLQGVIERLRKEEPDIYAAIGTAGALCARYVRGSRGSISSHAWGLAVDLTLKQNLDAMGDGSTQFGLVVLAEFFNDAGWYWGAGYGREDSMHFEVGEALLRQWIAEGKL